MKKFNRIVQSDRGMSLVMVLLILMLISVLAISMIGITSNNLTQSTGEHRAQSAYYIAEGGLTKVWTGAKELLEGGTTETDDFLCSFEAALEGTVTDFAINNGVQPEAVVTAVKSYDDCENPPVNETLEFTLVSEGSIGNRSRTVEKTFTLSPAPSGGFQLEGELSLYTDRSISLSGGARIDGSVASNSSERSTISLDGGVEITGNIYLPNPSVPGILNATDGDLRRTHEGRLLRVEGPYLEHVMPEFPAFPSYPFMSDATVGDQDNRFRVIDNGHLNITAWQTKSYELNLHSDVAFRSINVSQNNTLTINVGSVDRNIVVDDFNLANGNIRITGNGKLTLYVKNGMNFGSGSFNMDRPSNHLEMYWRGVPAGQPKKHLQIAADMKINGSLFAENANLTFTAGGGFLGHIVSGGDRITLSGGARVGESVIFAPYAQVRMEQGGSMKGAVISDSFVGTGGAILTYEEIDSENIPFLSGGGSASASFGLESEEPIRER